MSSYNFRRVLIEVITTEEVRTLDGVETMLRRLNDPTNMDNQLVRVSVIAEEDTLEQIACGSNVVPSGYVIRFAPVLTGMPYKNALEHACVAMGMEHVVHCDVCAMDYTKEDPCKLH